MTSCSYCIYTNVTPGIIFWLHRHPQSVSVVLLELPVSDVFPKVHIYLHRAQRISACLCCGALASVHPRVKNPLLRSRAAVCWLLPSLLDVCVKQGSKWLHIKKEKHKGSVTFGPSLSLPYTLTSHAQITCNNSYTLTYSSCHFFSPSIWCPPSLAPILAVTCLWETLSFDPDHQWDRTQLWLTPTSLQINQSYCNTSLSGSWQLRFP